MSAARQSAGILVYRVRERAIEVLLVHPGGPFWKNKDDGAWTIPKGEFADGEDPLVAARREFLEETGVAIDGAFRELAPRRLRSGKLVHAFAIEKDLDIAGMRSNTFTTQWPPKSGRVQSFPEVDRYAWFPLAIAAGKINAGQAPFLVELAEKL
jgi:predicted NUDIX family NTP pyrophosphohydrolase